MSETERAKRIIRGLLRYADGHELRGKWADELKALHYEAEQFCHTVPSRPKSETERADDNCALDCAIVMASECGRFGLVESLGALRAALSRPEAGSAEDRELADELERRLTGYLSERNAEERHRIKGVILKELWDNKDGIIRALQRSPEEGSAGEMRLRLPFACVDSQDWDYLLSALGDGGRDRFWKEVLRQTRAALSPSPASQDGGQ